MTTPPDIPFIREIRQGTIGKDVIGHKRALSRWDHTVYPWQDFSAYAGPYLVNAIIVFKERHGLGTAPKLGAVAHNALEKAHRKGSTTEWAFDALAIELCTQYYNEHHKTPEQVIRESIVSAAFYWYAHRYAIAYAQTRPFEECKPPIVPKQWDCSAFATNCHYAGGAPDPNGLGYNREGYTGTLIDHGTRVDTIHDLSPGDLIFYGHSSGRPGFNVGDPTHVAVYVGFINNMHMVISNGHYPMNFSIYNYRTDINQLRHYPVGV